MAAPTPAKKTTAKKVPAKKVPAKKVPPRTPGDTDRIAKLEAEVAELHTHVENLAKALAAVLLQQQLQQAPQTLLGQLLGGGAQAQ